MTSKATRGRYGQGSITRQPNGRWKASHSVGHDGAGSRRRESRVFDTRKQADLWLTEKRQQRNLGMSIIRESHTLESFAEWWLTNEAPLRVRSDTADHYRYLFERYIRPTLGKKRLDQLSSDQVVELLSALTRRGLGRETIKRARSILSLLCTQAISHRFMAHNPVSLVKPPKSSVGTASRVQQPLSRDEARELLGSVRGTSLDGIVLVAIYLGLRKGEILGLKWTDINLDERLLSVRRTLKEGTSILPDGTGLTHARTNPPKTRNSERTLPLPEALVAFFQMQKRREAELRLRAGEAWQNEGFVFVNDLGGPLWPSNVGKRFRQHLKTHGLRHVRFHDLRHSVAKIMLENEARLEEVSQALGHSTIAITKDIYAPYVEKLAHRAIDAMANALDGSLPMSIAVGQDVVGRSSRAPKWGGDT